MCMFTLGKYVCLKISVFLYFFLFLSVVSGALSFLFL